MTNLVTSHEYYLKGGLPVPGLVAAESALGLVHALEVRQHGGTVVGGEAAF